MRLDGAIFPKRDSSGFSREAWCEFVVTRPEFKQPLPKEATNPFTGEVITVYPSEDSSDVEVDGCVVGQVYWSMSDEPLVNVSIAPSCLLLVLEWASAIGGEFLQDQ
jgi:hypothetical protein